jgi:hypothetical protein
MKPIIVKTDSLNGLVYIAYPQLAEFDLTSPLTEIECVSDEQYKEVINNILIETKTEDRLAELEEAIALWTYKKGMKEELDIYIISKDREKVLKVVYAESYPAKNSLMFESRATTTKEMFDKAFEYFKVEEK